MIKGFVGIAVAMLAAGGCQTQRGWPDRSPGALGYADFCEDDSALECTPIGDDFAVGARLAVRVELSDRLPEEIELRGVESAAEEFVATTTTGLVAQRSGSVALLAMGTREVIDYKMVHLREVDAIALQLPERVPIGESFRAVAVAAADGVDLSGELDYTWVSKSDDLVVERNTGRRVADLLITTQEAVVVEVSAGGHTEAITITAYPGPSRRPPAPPDPPDPPGAPGPGGFDPGEPDDDGGR